MLGNSTVTGGPPEFERRISKAWSAFHAHRTRLTMYVLVSCDTLGPSAAPCLPGLGLLLLGVALDVVSRSRAGATVSRIIRSVMVLREDECWWSWDARTLRDPQKWIATKLGCTYSDWFLRQSSKKWGSWLARHELPPHPVDGLAKCCALPIAGACSFRGSAWKRRRVGRPPRRWEAPKVVAR